MDEEQSDESQRIDSNNPDGVQSGSIIERPSNPVSDNFGCYFRVGFFVEADNNNQNYSNLVAQFTHQDPLITGYSSNAGSAVFGRYVNEVLGYIYRRSIGFDRSNKRRRASSGLNSERMPYSINNEIPQPMSYEFNYGGGRMLVNNRTPPPNESSGFNINKMLVNNRTPPPNESSGFNIHKFFDDFVKNQKAMQLNRNNLFRDNQNAMQTTNHSDNLFGAAANQNAIQPDNNNLLLFGEFNNTNQYSVEANDNNYFEEFAAGGNRNNVVERSMEYDNLLLSGGFGVNVVDAFQSNYNGSNEQTAMESDDDSNASCENDDQNIVQSDHTDTGFTISNGRDTSRRNSSEFHHNSHAFSSDDEYRRFLDFVGGVPRSPRFNNRRGRANSRYNRGRCSNAIANNRQHRRIACTTSSYRNTIGVSHVYTNEHSNNFDGVRTDSSSSGSLQLDRHERDRDDDGSEEHSPASSSSRLNDVSVSQSIDHSQGAVVVSDSINGEEESGGVVDGSVYSSTHSHQRTSRYDSSGDGFSERCCDSCTSRVEPIDYLDLVRRVRLGLRQNSRRRRRKCRFSRTVGQVRRNRLITYTTSSSESASSRPKKFRIRTETDGCTPYKSTPKLYFSSSDSDDGVVVSYSSGEAKYKVISRQSVDTNSSSKMYNNKEVYGPSPSVNYQNSTTNRHNGSETLDSEEDERQVYTIEERLHIIQSEMHCFSDEEPLTDNGSSESGTDDDHDEHSELINRNNKFYWSTVYKKDNCIKKSYDERIFYNRNLRNNQFLPEDGHHAYASTSGSLLNTQNRENDIGHTSSDSNNGTSAQGGYNKSARRGYNISPRGGYSKSAQGGYSKSARGGYKKSTRGGYRKSTRGGYNYSPRGGYNYSPRGGYNYSPRGGYNYGAREGYNYNAQGSYDNGTEEGYGNNARGGYGNNARGGYYKSAPRGSYNSSPTRGGYNNSSAARRGYNSEYYERYVENFDSYIREHDSDDKYGYNEENRYRNKGRKGGKNVKNNTNGGADKTNGTNWNLAPEQKVAVPLVQQEVPAPPLKQDVSIPLLQQHVSVPILQETPQQKILVDQQSISVNVWDDLLSRFVVNVPPEHFDDALRVSFQVELCHWFYLDYYCGEMNSFSPRISLKDFFFQLLSRLPGYNITRQQCSELYHNFQSFKSKVPKCGVIILNGSLTKILLVQCYMSSYWIFPRGKVNESENPLFCAIRETYEETGIDITNNIYPTEFVERNINERYIRLYFAIIPEVPSKKFVPRTKGEIRAVKWFDLNSIPSGDRSLTLQIIGDAPTENTKVKFYMISPFMESIREWINLNRTGKLPMLKNSAANHHSADTNQREISSSSTTIVDPIDSTDNTSTTIIEDSTSAIAVDDSIIGSSSADEKIISFEITTTDSSTTASDDSLDCPQFVVVLNREVQRTIIDMSLKAINNRFNNKIAGVQTSTEQQIFSDCFGGLFDDDFDTSLSRVQLVTSLTAMIRKYFDTLRHKLPISASGVRTLRSDISILELLNKDTFHHCVDFLVETFELDGNRNNVNYFIDQDDDLDDDLDDLDDDDDDEVLVIEAYHDEVLYLPISSVSDENVENSTAITTYRRPAVYSFNSVTERKKNKKKRRFDGINDDGGDDETTLEFDGMVYEHKIVLASGENDREFVDTVLVPSSSTSQKKLIMTHPNSPTGTDSDYSEENCGLNMTANSNENVPDVVADFFSSYNESIKAKEREEMPELLRNMFDAAMKLE